MTLREKRATDRCECNTGVGGYFPALEAVGLADHVERSGETYGFSVDGVGDPDGEARIEAGSIDGKMSRAP
jgi:hypothetical protein